MTEILAIGTRRNNAKLMVDLRDLGYLDDDVLDATYEQGRFWKLWRPAGLVTNDIAPKIICDHHFDFRALPFADRSFRSVVLDPPYKLNGTSTGKGPAAADARYGVGGEYMPIRDRHQLIIDGITDCARVARCFLILKCQDQVSSGRVQWQTRIFSDHAEAIGLRLVDSLHVQGRRKQSGRQVHARRDYSTALVFKKVS